MKHSRLRLLASLLLMFSLPCWAHNGESYRDFATPQVRSDQLAAPEHLRNYVVEGKLRLSSARCGRAGAGEQQPGASAGDAD